MEGEKRERGNWKERIKRGERGKRKEGRERREKKQIKSEEKCIKKRIGPSYLASACIAFEFLISSCAALIVFSSFDFA